MPASKRRKRRVAHSQRQVKNKVLTEAKKENVPPPLNAIEKTSTSSTTSASGACNHGDSTVLNGSNDTNWSYWESINSLTNGLSQVYNYV